MQNSIRSLNLQLLPNSKVALRMDDVGAASKKNEQYSKRWYGLGNFLWLKRAAYFKAWGPYAELSGSEWEEIFQILIKTGAKLTVAITATWVEDDGTLVPFPEKFRLAAEALKVGLKAGLVEIANHGLTHCVLENMRFRPRAFLGNRSDHREFWEWLPEATHFQHLRQSQEILEGFFGLPITTLVPPGNVFSEATLRAALDSGIKVVNCNLKPGYSNASGLKVIGNQSVVPFHDRELVLFGLGWLEALLATLPENPRFCFIKELGND
jgi:peptidoglycan/xylan/chitin deacetylase (PgdA/CDA1 family)